VIRTFLRGGAVPFMWAWRHRRGTLAVLGLVVLWLTPIGLVMYLFPPTIITVPIVIGLFCGGAIFIVAGAIRAFGESDA
jgi:hypothetical protein